MLPEFPNCPRCDGLISREHYATEPLAGHGPDHEVTLIYCEFCRLGRETLWQVHAGRHFEQFSLDYNQDKDPILFGKFLQRLQDRRVSC